MSSDRHTPTEAAVALLDLYQHIEDGTELSVKSSKLISGAILDIVESDFRISLDAALGLRTQGGLSLPRLVALRRRDEMLGRLYATQVEWKGLRPAAAARMMSLSAGRYASDRWPREKSDVSAPSAEPAATWWRILRMDVPLPGVRRLQQILESEIQ